MQGATSPLEQPYLETSPVTLWRKRVVRLLMLFIAEAYTSTVLHAFEDRLEAAISLAFFIPLLIGTGGNSGTQITSTLVRAMALGEVSLRNVWSVLRKEITTSIMVALTMGIAGIYSCLDLRGWHGSDDSGGINANFNYGLECYCLFYYSNGIKAYWC